MDSTIILILTGFIIGGLGTMVGAGGGFLLVPLLIFTFPDMPSAITTAISTAVVGTNAISGSIAYARTKRVDFRSGLLFAGFAIPGSILGVFLVNYIPKHFFNIVFGSILIVAACYLFLNKRRLSETIKIQSTGRNIERQFTDSNGAYYRYSFNKTEGIIISIGTGFLSALMGIGGGIIHVPAMVQWLQFPINIATATSHFVLAIMSAVSVIVHLLQGSYNDAVIQRLLLYLCLGVIPGAQFGACLSHRLHSDIMLKILAICLLLVGIRILL